MTFFLILFFINSTLFFKVKNEKITKKYYFSCFVTTIPKIKDMHHLDVKTKQNKKKHYINIYIHFHEDNAQICCVSMFWDYIFTSDILYLSWQLGKQFQNFNSWGVHKPMLTLGGFLHVNVVYKCPHKLSSRTRKHENCPIQVTLTRQQL